MPRLPAPEEMLMILPPPPRACHVPGHGPRDQVGAAHVDPHHLVEGFLFQLHHQHPVLARGGNRRC